MITSVFFVVSLAAVILLVLLIGLKIMEPEYTVIGKPIYVLGVISLVISLFGVIGTYSSTEKYIYIKTYEATKSFYYEEENNSDLFLVTGKPSKKMAFLADNKRYEVYESDIEDRYEFADSRNKKGTTKFIVEIPKIRTSAPDWNKNFFIMSHFSQIKVTRTIYK